MSRIFFADIEVGHAIVTARRTVTEADIVNFAGLSGDFNPLHTDAVFVKENTSFDRPIAHGLLGVAISSGLRSEYDNWDVLAFLECTRKFAAPIFAGDTIHCEYAVASTRASTSRAGAGIVTMDVKLVNAEGTIVQTGRDVTFVGGREADS